MRKDIPIGRRGDRVTVEPMAYGTRGWVVVTPDRDTAAWEPAEARAVARALLAAADAAEGRTAGATIAASLPSTAT